MPAPTRSRSVRPGTITLDDRISTRDAIPLAGCTNAEAFAIERWRREQPCDHHGRRISWPTCDEAAERVGADMRAALKVALGDAATHECVGFSTLWRVPYLTTAQLKRRSAAEQVVLGALKAARVAWADEQYLRVPEWGGLKRPGAEWGFSRTRMTEWYRRFIAGEPVLETTEASPDPDPDAFDRANEATAAGQRNRKIAA